MGDIASDREAALEMVRDAYKALSAQNPQHELLTVADLHADQGGVTFKPDYFRRFVKADDCYNVHGYIRYWEALKVVVEGRSTVI